MSDRDFSLCSLTAKGHRLSGTKHVSISICDDDEIVHQAVTEMILRAYGRRYSGLEVIHYRDAALLLREAERQRIVLMDIDMPGMDGIEAAGRLHEVAPESIVIMLTGRSDRMKEAFKVRATRFVTKPIESEELFEALDDAIGSLREFEDLVFTMQGRRVRVNPRDLVMLEADRNNVILYLPDRSISLRGSMRGIERLLTPELFMRVHKSYIVNLGHVREVRGRELLLTDGLRAAVSSRHEHAALERLRAFDLDGSS